MSTQLIGSEPLLVLQFVDAANVIEEPLFFSTNEVPAALSGFGHPIYGLLDSVQGYSSVANTTGYGSVSTVQVVASDAFGFWRRLVMTRKLHDFTVHVWLAVYEANGHKFARKLFTGKIMPPITWTELTRNLSFEVVEHVEYKKFGYTPDFADIPYIAPHLNGEAKWPHVFGSPEHYEIRPMCNAPTAQLRKNIVFFYDTSTPVYDPLHEEWTFEISYPPAEAYPETETTLYVGESFLRYWPIIDGRTLPPEPRWFNLAVPGGSARAHGRPVFLSGQWFLELTLGQPFNQPLYTDIVVTAAAQQVPGAQAYTGDRPEYQPYVITLLGYGNYLGAGSVNVYGELVPASEVTTEFSLGDYPWLVGCYVRMIVARVVYDAQATPSVTTMTVWGLVAEQQGNAVLLGSVLDSNDQAITLSGWTPLFITFAQRNKIWQPNTQVLFPPPTIKSQTPQNTGIVAFPRVIEEGDTTRAVVDSGVVLQANSTITLTDWWGSLIYPITLDDVSTVSEIYLKTGTQLLPLSSFLHYRLWQQVEGEYTQLEGELAVSPDPFMALLEAERWPVRWTFLELRASGTALRVLETGGVLVVKCSNELNTDERVFEWVVNTYTSDTAVQHEDLTRHRTVGFIVEGDQTAEQFLGQLCLEHAKGVARKVGTVRTSDLLVDELPRRTFNERNTEELVLALTTPDAYQNRLKVTGSWTEGFLLLKDEYSISRLGDLEGDLNFDYNRTYDTLEGEYPYEQSSWVSGEAEQLARGFLRVAYYWLQEGAVSFLEVQFTTYLDAWLSRGADHLVANEYVKLNYLYTVEDTPADSSPLALPIGDLLGMVLPDDASPQDGVGRILEVSLDPSTWAVKMRVRLRIAQGE